MNSQIKELLFNAESLVKKNSKHDFPTYDQCIGSNKLLGEYYAQAITQFFCIPDLFEQLNELSSLIRVYVVLDDFIFDNKYHSKDFESIINEIEKQCLKKYSKLSCNAFVNWNHVKYQSKFAQVHFKNIKPYNSIFQKNYFVMIPLLIDRIPDDLNQKYKVFQEFNQLFLFILQIIDDFEDLESDFNSSSNQNYFNCKLNNIDFSEFSKYKSIILNEILLYTYKSLTKMQQTSIIESATISKFISNGLQWTQKHHQHFFNSTIEDAFQDLQFISTESLFDRHLLAKIQHFNLKSQINDFSSASVNSFHNINCY